MLLLLAVEHLLEELELRGRWEDEEDKWDQEVDELHLGVRHRACFVLEMLDCGVVVVGMLLVLFWASRASLGFTEFSANGSSTSL